jgi:hypothetical protein
MVEVMSAAHASMPANFRAGKVTNDPPPASAFWAPAETAATNKTSKISARPPISFHRLAYELNSPGGGLVHAV